MADCLKKSIVRIYGGDARFLVIYEEYAPGYDLTMKDVWRNATDNNFCGSEGDVFQVSTNIARALEYVHSQGLTHNDIKSANILLCRKLGTKLCDFGLAELSSSQTSRHAGSPWYVPPEYITDGRRGQPGDVFALGVMILYLRKLLPLPDASGGFKIADIHNSRKKELQQVARKNMSLWQAMVQAAKEKLEHSTEDLIIQDILNPG
jgi:serine/threonine protein kinase